MTKSLLLTVVAMYGISALAAVPKPPAAKGTDHKVNAQVMRQIKANDAQAKVLSESILAPGVKEQVCALPGGAAYKRIVKADGSIPIRILKSPDTKEEAEGALLNEGFEGWDGTTKNWIPATWSEINSTGEAGTYNDGAFTWYVSAQNGTLPNPVEGQYYCIIPYAQVTRDDNTKEDLPQDEWLVTPKFTPRANEQLSFSISYSPLYLYDMSNENVDFSSMQFKNQIVAATLKVYVRETGGQWVEIYDIEPAWHNKTLNELFNDYFSQIDEKVTLPLNDYEGKEIEVAFQYAGIRGNTMELDQVVVDKAKLSVGYSRPAGAMFWGLSKDLEYPFYDETAQQPFTLLHVPAFTDLKWTNTSSENATAFNWTFDDGTANDKDLTLNFMPSRDDENGVWGMPSLTASAPGFADASYQIFAKGIYAGGAPQSGNYNFPLTLANVQKDDVNFLYNSQSIPLSGFHKYTKTVWTNMILNKNPTETDYYAPLGFLTKFEKPAKPYIVKRVWVMAYGLINEGSTFNFVFYRCSPSDMPYGAFASAECAYSDIVKIPVGYYSYYAIPFDLTSEDAGAPVTIDRDVMGMVYGLDGNEDNTIYLLQTVSYDAADTNSQFIYLVGAEGGNSQVFFMPMSALTDAAGNRTKTNLYMELETDFPWLQPNCDTEQFIGTDGGDLKLRLDSYYDASQLSVTVTDEQGAPVDWITTTGAGKNTDAVITASVQAMSARATERVAHINVACQGCDNVEFTITQNTSTGIHSVANNHLSVSVDGNSIFVNNVNGEVVVYDVTGKVVAKAMAKGNAVINASLGNGVYIVKTSDKTVKVVK